MRTTTNRPPNASPRALRDPADILEQLLGIVRRHFSRVPTVVTTDRRGRFEAAWTVERDQRLVPLGNVNLPLAAKQRNQVHMAALIAEYADHPRATRSLLERNARYPQSIELRLRPYR
ncbi:hypothetical protein AB0M39_41470 [Streptomyces sp. NPDC051907]|uniref:hypothetical protein n=1 Tax=Streptomyces sp. NPDC051907 TaxID=3155284 RepID=UPI003445F440